MEPNRGPKKPEPNAQKADRKRAEFRPLFKGFYGVHRASADCFLFAGSVKDCDGQLCFTSLSGRIPQGVQKTSVEMPSATPVLSIARFSLAVVHFTVVK
jgi:hypothetical protein